MVDEVAPDKSEEVVDQSLVDRLLRDEDDGGTEEEEIVEIEVSRGDFRGILRELRTLKNVIIEGVVDGVKNFKNDDFNRYGYPRTSGSPDSNLESTEIRPKQEKEWPGGDDFDGYDGNDGMNYDDDEVDDKDEDSEPKVKKAAKGHVQFHIQGGSIRGQRRRRASTEEKRAKLVSTKNETDPKIGLEIFYGTTVVCLPQKIPLKNAK